MLTKERLRGVYHFELSGENVDKCLETKLYPMSKFIFSSFVIGVGTSVFVSLAVNERLFERKLMFQPKENTDELVQAYYEQVCPRVSLFSCDQQ